MAAWRLAAYLMLVGLLLPAGSPASAAAAASSPAVKAAAPAAADTDEPSVTTASFVDWTLRCQRTGTADKPARLCEVGAVLHVPGQSGPIAQVAIGRLVRTDPLRVTALVPPNVSFPSAVRVTLGDKDEAPLDLAWRRCLSGACVADGPIRDETLARWRTASDPGRLSFTDAAGRVPAAPLSMNGLAQALTALAREQP